MKEQPLTVDRLLAALDALIDARAIGASSPALATRARAALAEFAAIADVDVPSLEDAVLAHMADRAH